MSEPSEPLCSARKGLAGYLYCLPRSSDPLKQFISWARLLAESLHPIPASHIHYASVHGRASVRAGRDVDRQPPRVRPPGQIQSQYNSTEDGPSRHRHTHIHTHRHTDRHHTHTSQTAMDRVACGCRGRPERRPPPYRKQ